MTRHSVDGGLSPKSLIQRRIRRGPGLELWPRACIYRDAVIDSLTNSLERYMDLVSTRQKLVASNIANADTPGYKTQDIDFQKSVPVCPRRRQRPTHRSNRSRHEERRQQRRSRSGGPSPRRKRLRFSIATNLMKTEIATVKEAIKEGPS